MKIDEKKNFFEKKIKIGPNLKIHQKKAKNRDFFQKKLKFCFHLNSLLFVVK